MLTPTEKQLIRIVIRCNGLDDTQQDAIGQSDDLARQYINNFRAERLEVLGLEIAECDTEIFKATERRNELVAEQSIWTEA